MVIDSISSFVRRSFVAIYVFVFMASKTKLNRFPDVLYTLYRKRDVNTFGAQRVKYLNLELMSYMQLFIFPCMPFAPPLRPAFKRSVVGASCCR